MEKLGYTRVDPDQIEGNLIKMIASDWMLVTAGDKTKFNTMTANWGGTGYLWNRPVAFVFVRPQRYTYQFTESYEFLTLSFFDPKDAKIRKALNICGTKSGRDCDKIGEASLVLQFTSLGNPTFKDAKMVVECKKLYAEFLRPDSFLDNNLLDSYYEDQSTLHKMYIAEIKSVWIK